MSILCLLLAIVALIMLASRIGGRACPGCWVVEPGQDGHAGGCEHGFQPRGVPGPPSGKMPNQGTSGRRT